ncbi:hypothetical protein SFOMI_3424 [Sphingobium fuliginis]|nr:hypothetical protein SFOMI_3424 [Sphingobium fuliginis]
MMAKDSMLEWLKSQIVRRKAECRRWAEHHTHPERGDITVA